MILLILWGFLTVAGLGLIGMFLFKVFKFILHAFKNRGELVEAFKEGSAEEQAKQDAKKVK